MTTEEAIDIVARQALVNHGAEPEWGDFPEIGEQDWLAVQDRALKLALQTAPNTRDYKAAYNLLTERAETAEATQ